MSLCSAHRKRLGSDAPFHKGGGVYKMMWNTSAWRIHLHSPFHSAPCFLFSDLLVCVLFCFSLWVVVEYHFILWYSHRPSLGSSFSSSLTDPVSLTIPSVSRDLSVCPWLWMPSSHGVPFCVSDPLGLVRMKKKLKSSDVEPEWVWKSPVESKQILECFKDLECRRDVNVRVSA